MSVHPAKNLTPTTIIKLLLLGQSNVGKTSLATRYSEDRFNAQSNLLTVGIDIRKIDKEIKGKNVRLQLWDTAGQEKYKTIPSQYFKGVQGIILVYDITDNESFHKIQDWIEKVQQNRGYDQLIMMLVGNKVDRSNEREVKEQQANSFAVEKGMGFNQTSAKESLNVDKMIDQVIRTIFEKGIKCPVKNFTLQNNNESKRSMEESGCCS